MSNLTSLPNQHLQLLHPAVHPSPTSRLKALPAQHHYHRRLGDARLSSQLRLGCQFVMEWSISSQLSSLVVVLASITPLVLYMDW